MKYGLLTPTEAPGGLTCMLVNTSEPGQYRLVYDLRQLNKVIEKSKFPIPNIDDIIHSLKDKKYYAKGDLVKAFPSIQLTPENAKKIIITTPVGKFQCNTLPEGLTISTEIFQSFINRHFGHLIADGDLKIYVDDVIWSENNFDSLLGVIETTLEWLNCHHKR